MRFKLPLHIAHHRAYLFDGRGQFLLANAEFFAPILDLVSLLHVDPVTVSASRFSLSSAIRHLKLISEVDAPRDSPDGDLEKPFGCPREKLGIGQQLRSIRRSPIFKSDVYLQSRFAGAVHANRAASLNS